MLHWKEFSAWVAIDGKETLEYDVEISEDQKTVTCWIASELGKKFSVHWKNSSFYGATSGQVKMDGTSCGGKIIYSHKLPVTVFKDGVMDATTLKPFMFSSLALTDDDAYLGGTSLPDLGLIELVISPVRVLPATQSYAPAPISDLSMLKVHERSKKAVTQQITLAAPQKLEKPTTFVSTARAGPDLVKFCFKYRPMDILRANGIAPPPPQLKRMASPEPSRVQSPQTDVKRVKKENKPVKHEADKKSRVKREASDVIDLTQDNMRGKRVKLENFIQGEIIDLT